MRYSNACLSLFVVILQDLNIHFTTLIIGVLSFTITPILTFIEAFGSEIR